MTWLGQVVNLLLRLDELRFQPLPPPFEPLRPPGFALVASNEPEKWSIMTWAILAANSALPGGKGKAQDEQAAVELDGVAVGHLVVEFYALRYATVQDSLTGFSLNSRPASSNPTRLRECKHKEASLKGRIRKFGSLEWPSFAEISKSVQLLDQTSGAYCRDVNSVSFPLSGEKVRETFHFSLCR